MNIVLCDDEKEYISSLQQAITLWSLQSGHKDGIVFHTFTSSEDLMEALSNKLHADALFLDICIPGELNGMAVAKEIREANEYIPIVFVTNYGEYAEEGYSVNALRYLRKPIQTQALCECMNIIWRQWTYRHINNITLETSGQVLRLPLDTIVFVEVNGHFCSVKTTVCDKPYRFRMTLEEVRSILPKGIFAQCHRSYIVNLMYIRHITGKSITMADGTLLQIGRVYQSHLMKQLRHYYLEGDED